LLTLYTTPVVYLYLDRVQQWLAGRKQEAEPAAAAPAVAAE
jgi:HAE1 family hydrophobic/amphiphilic exporter-1